MPDRNYLLGKGERLIQGIGIRPGGTEKLPPYEFSTAQDRIGTNIRAVATELSSLPAIACPNDEAVIAIAINPEQIAKSYYPADLLNATGMRAVGSRTALVFPENVPADQRRETPTTELFAAAPRAAIRRFASEIGSWSSTVAWADDLRKIEAIRVVPISQRVKPLHSAEQRLLFEAVIHGAGNSVMARTILEAFRRFLASLGIDVDTNRRIDTANLSFVAVDAGIQQARQIAQFSFLRAIREMPSLRPFEPTFRAIDGEHYSFECPVTEAHVLNSEISVAVLDGGIPDVPSLRYCVVREDVPGIGEEVPEFVEHGLAVTSAVLFGSLRDGETPESPFARVHHFRVLDAETYNDSRHEMYTVLDRIEAALKSRHFDYVNCSLGPAIPVDDDDVHPWTAKLDELCADGSTLLTAAAGNTGQSPAESMLNRFQPPADGVNLLGIGSCDSDEPGWKRASYSSVGKGRSPGIVKPDGLGFGGSRENPFWVISSDDPDYTAPTCGTSLASPNVLRAGIGLSALLGREIGPLAAKAILLHSCDLAGHSIAEVGWGKICTIAQRLIATDDHTIAVIYQDVIEPKKWIQADIPMLAAPDMTGGYVAVSATVCIATPVDPQHPQHYTRAGLDIVFRRDKLKPGRMRKTKDGEKKAAKTAPSTTFFRSIEGISEADLRADYHKWETVRKAAAEFQGRTLVNPALDIHFNPRRDACDTLTAEPIPYAMVISVSAPKVADFYNRVVNRFRTKLEVLVPKIKIRVSGS